MAKKTSKKSTRKKTASKTAKKTPNAGRSRSASAGSRSRSRSSVNPADAKGKHLVIVESPTKAKTINKYLGNDYMVMASVGHVRDLPSRAPKGQKQDVPGVDLANDFEPSYEVLPDKKKTVTDLKKAAKQAEDVWFATDLDREGEAIAWHLAEALDIRCPRRRARGLQRHHQERDRARLPQPAQHRRRQVNAQQARRILDRIVGYQVSPLLWKKVAGGLSAGRVQSVATRLVVEREREIEAFTPEEYWKITGLFTPTPEQARDLAAQWQRFLDEAKADENRKQDKRTVREQNAWLSEHECLRAELVELDGKRLQGR